MSDDPIRTYVPNTFQKPNVFVDKLLRLLSGNEAKLLDAATREILGWDRSRATRRARISLSRFEELAGMSRQGVVDNLKALVEANILLPIGDWTSDGQMYEINLGQKGDYDFYYLEHRQRRGGNPNPSAAREALAAKVAKPDAQPAPNIPAISGGAGGLLNRPPEEPEIVSGLSQQTAPGLLDRPLPVYAIDTTNKKPKITDIKLSVDDGCPGGEGLADLWREVKEEIAPGFANFDAWFVDTCLTLGQDGAYVVLAPAVHIRDWIANRMGTRIQQALANKGHNDRQLRFDIRH